MHISFRSCFKEPLETSIQILQDQAHFASRQCSYVRESTCEVHILGTIETQPHPPYSSDLVMSDFILFPNVKDQLQGIKYETREELGVAIIEALRLVSHEGLSHVFDAWLRGCHKCIKVKGSYVDKEWIAIEVSFFVIEIFQKFSNLLIIPCIWKIFCH